MLCAWLFISQGPKRHSFGGMIHDTIRVFAESFENSSKNPLLGNPGPFFFVLLVNTSIYPGAHHLSCKLKILFLWALNINTPGILELYKHVLKRFWY